MSNHSVAVKVGDQVFTSEGGEEIGAVRVVSHDHLTIYLENSGDFVVKAAAVHAVHDGKVVLDYTRLEPALKAAIQSAHSEEKPGL